MIYAMEKRWFGEGGGCGMISRKLEGEKKRDRRRSSPSSPDARHLLDTSVQGGGERVRGRARGGGQGGSRRLYRFSAFIARGCSNHDRGVKEEGVFKQTRLTRWESGGELKEERDESERRERSKCCIHETTCLAS